MVKLPPPLMAEIEYTKLRKNYQMQYIAYLLDYYIIKIQKSD